MRRFTSAVGAAKFAMTAALTAILTTGTAFAFTPEKPECVAPAKPGGGFDLTCRIGMGALEAIHALDRPMAVTFMPGGVGAVAYNQFNTIRTKDHNAIVALSSGSALAIAQGKWGRWTENDARFVAAAGADFGAYVVRADSPYKTLDDMIAAIRAKPDSVVVGAGGSVGGQDWMKTALLFKALGKDPRQMRYVAFEGGGDAITNLLGGNIDMMPGDVAEMKPHLESGSMRILAILAPNRLPAPFDKFPTAKELGYDVEWTIFRGFYMGKDVSDEAYNFYADAFKKAYASDEFKKIREDKGLFPFESAGADFDKYVKERVAAQRELAKEVGLIQ